MAKSVKFKGLKKCVDEDFRRMIGVKRATFDEMVTVLKRAKKAQKAKGRPNKLRIEDRLLMALEYLREYRTYFHLGGR